MLLALDNIDHVIDKGSLTMLISLDLSAAFNRLITPYFITVFKPALASLDRSSLGPIIILVLKFVSVRVQF